MTSNTASTQELRGKTDQSLEEERVKTDDLEQSEKSVEEETDEAIRLTRLARIQDLPGSALISPFTMTLQVPYAENEQQFLLQAVEAAVKMLRSLNAKTSDGFGEASATRTAQDEPTAHLALVS